MIFRRYKAISIVFVLLLILIFEGYVFFSQPLVVSKIIPIKALPQTALNFISTDNIVKKYFNFLNMPEYKENILGYVRHHANIHKEKIEGLISVILYKNDTSFLVFKYSFDKTMNPFVYIKNYYLGINLKEKLNASSKNIVTNSQVIKEVYGIDIKHEKVQYELFMSQKLIFQSEPSLEILNYHFNNLKKYITSVGGKVVGEPMINNQYKDKKHHFMIAFPIDTSIKENNTYQLKRMFKGNVLKVEVKGGFGEILKAKHTIKRYIQDNSLACPAIEFESLITPRVRLADSINWITNVYFPIY